MSQNEQPYSHNSDNYDEIEPSYGRTSSNSFGNRQRYKKRSTQDRRNSAQHFQPPYVYPNSSSTERTHRSSSVLDGEHVSADKQLQPIKRSHANAGTSEPDLSSSDSKSESSYGRAATSSKSNSYPNLYTNESTNPSRYWVGTYYPTEKEQKEYMSSGTIPPLRMEKDREDIMCWRGQWEWGGKGDKDGKLHVQFAVAFRDQCRVPQARRILGGQFGYYNGWLAPAYSKSAMWEYCIKEDTRVMSIPGWGVMIDEQGQRSDLDLVYDAIRDGAHLWDIISRFPKQFMRNHAAISKMCTYFDRPRDYGECHVEIWFGITGSGKSHKAFHEYPNAYRKTIPGKWWEGYQGQKEVILEEFNPIEEIEVRLPEILKMCDKYPYQIEIKGSSCQLKANTFIFTSNVHPKLWYAGHPQLAAFCRRVSRVLRFTMSWPDVEKYHPKNDGVIEYEGMSCPEFVDLSD